MADLTSQNITIAITVYDRRDYVFSAIRSALSQLGQDCPRVMVVEDCGPDPDLQKAIVTEFGGRISYHRNATRRGLFDNWNACIEVCDTPWLCILHDDDFLEPTFVESIVELAATIPGCGLYYGLCNVVDAQGALLQSPPASEVFQGHKLDLQEWTHYNPVCFPGQLFNVTAARALGGFRPTSRYCADWEMWFKLTLNYGAAMTNRIVANFREHHTIGRGTTDVDISGRKYALINAQRKRHVAWLHRIRPTVRFDRRAFQKREPMPTRFLLRHAHGFSPLMLRYNAGLLLLSRSPHIAHYALRTLTRLLTWRILRPISKLFHLSGN